MKRHKYLATLPLLSITLIFILHISACSDYSVGVDYPHDITKYLYKKDGTWTVSYWDYYAYRNNKTTFDSVVADTILKPDDIWFFSEEQDEVHDYYHLGNITLEDGSKLEFEWEIDGFKHDDFPDLVMTFDDDNNIFGEATLRCNIEHWDDDKFRVNFRTGSSGFEGFHSENTLELIRK